MTTTLAADLRRISAFADLPDDQLAWLAGHMKEVRLQPGEISTVEGAPADSMLIVLEGEIQARREKTPTDGRVYIVRAGEVSGMLPFSRMTSFGATGRAVIPTRLARLPAALFPEMLQRIPVLESRLVGILADRIRETTRVEQQIEKLTALGKLSAGLAHELNNPAAAARRSSGELKGRLQTLRCLTATLLEKGLAMEAAHASCELREKAVERAPEPAPDPLAASEREDEITAWLEDKHVPRAWALAGTFAAARLTVADLEGLEARVPPDALGDVLAWAETGLAADSLADEVESAVRRISELVSAVKSYSHMDSAPSRAETDLPQEIDSAITMLTHEIRKKNVSLTRDYAPDFPRVSVFAGELNQVWTNLLDNAIDAVAPGGHVTVRTFRENSHAVVEIEDDGPGIPPEIRDRIWEPFFTTKPMGEGVGLGLDTVRRIVVRRHGGEITVASVPGETRFTVRLPV
ncbi:MAG TPA: ATP-binding protein [Thermoanaerobaculia bacterium]|nr:ATP-binding protein [Thermoanaerobaculia bacterium]